MPEFKHHNLKIVKPSFDSNLTDLIIDLDHLRKKQLGNEDSIFIFSQLKSVFHILESIGSARIEGNNTTIAEYIETKIDDDNNNDNYNIIEIQNIENAMDFIEDNIHDIEINKRFLDELHQLVVMNLPPPSRGGEGDLTPGKYRDHNISIKNSKHSPPEFLKVQDYMEELFEFINNEDSPKYDLLKCAIAHHRFVWIHPYGNGNGRTVRLFTYALLLKKVFNEKLERIINPTAVFCNDRQLYYEKLSMADLGTDEGVLNWCEYVLSGLKKEIEKIDKLSDFKFLKENILYPALNYSLDRKTITDIEYKILKKSVDLKVIQSSDLTEILKGKSSALRSKEINKLLEKRMLKQEKEGGRKYIINISNNYLLRGVINSLDQNNFLPSN